MFCLNQSNFWSSQEEFNNYFFLSLFVTRVSSENFLQSKFYIHECFSIWISNVFRLIDIFKTRGPFLSYSQYHSNYKSPLYLYDSRNERLSNDKWEWMKYFTSKSIFTKVSSKYGFNRALWFDRCIQIHYSNEFDLFHVMRI